MIFVTVGSSSIPFDRLLHAVDRMRIDERLVVQHGASAVRPGRAECVDFLGHREFVDLVRSARLIVTHAGVGSIMTALAERRSPVVVPRRGSLGEAVDDHQVSFARRAAELGFVRLVEDVDRLADAITGDVPDGLRPGASRSPIELELRTYIEECIGPGSVAGLSDGRTA